MTRLLFVRRLTCHTASTKGLQAQYASRDCYSMSHDPLTQGHQARCFNQGSRKCNMQETVSTLLQETLNVITKSRSEEYIFSKPVEYFYSKRRLLKSLTSYFIPPPRSPPKTIAFTTESQKPYNLVKTLPSRLPSPCTKPSRSKHIGDGAEKNGEKTPSYHVTRNE